MYTYIHAYMHTCIHTYIHLFACMHAYMHACIHAYMHTCIHAYIHTYMHTCIHAYMHTYIHTYICLHEWSVSKIFFKWTLARWCLHVFRAPAARPKRSQNSISMSKPSFLSFFGVDGTRARFQIDEDDCWCLAIGFYRFPKPPSHGCYITQIQTCQLSDLSAACLSSNWGFITQGFILHRSSILPFGFD